MTVVEGDSERSAPSPTAPQTPTPQPDQAPLIHADFMTITVFPTWEAFYAFFEEYQRDTYQVYVSKTSTSITTRNRRLIEQLNTSERLRDYNYRLIPPEFKVYTRTLVCTHSGKPRSRSQGLRPKQSSRAMECPARINLLVQKKNDDSGWHIVVRTQVTSHNHPLDAASFVLHPRNRKVQDPMVLEAVNALRKAGVKRQKIRTYIEEKVPSKHVTRSDVNNLLARMKNDTEFISNAFVSRPSTPPAVTQVESMQSAATQAESTQPKVVDTAHTGNEQTPDTAVAVSFSLRGGGSGGQELSVSQPTTQPTSQQNNSDAVSDANSLHLLRETTHVASGVFKLRVKRLEEQNLALFKQNNKLILQNRQYVADLDQASKKAAEKGTRLMAMQRSHASLKATLRALTQEMASLKEENARLNMLDQIQSDDLQYGGPVDEQLAAETEQPAKRSLPVDTSGSDGTVEFVIRPQKRSK
ncbi:hypothetical protein V7S43_019070 [Phytophthora oleae]|uniref:ZSWIM3 N-terminal domain-containing protein n=1 Tax=Phytophthora oleae TaxID=2107226 RepID=A0ABD3FC00_9STRA